VDGAGLQGLGSPIRDGAVSSKLRTVAQLVFVMVNASHWLEGGKLSLHFCSQTM